MNIFWSNPDINPEHNISHVDYTWSGNRDNMMLHSIVDHFVGTKTVFEAVTEADVLHSSDNLSDHSPIFCKLKVGNLDVSLENEKKKSVPSWKKSKENEKEAWSLDITERLNKLQMPNCFKLCKNVIHGRDIRKL